MIDKLIQLAKQGGEAPDSGRVLAPDVQQPTEFGGREPAYKPKKMQLSPKAKKLLKKKRETDAKLEKELRDTKLGDLLDEESEYAETPLNLLGPY